MSASWLILAQAAEAVPPGGTDLTGVFRVLLNLGEFAGAGAVLYLMLQEMKSQRGEFREALEKLSARGDASQDKFQAQLDSIQKQNNRMQSVQNEVIKDMNGAFDALRKTVAVMQEQFREFLGRRPSSSTDIKAISDDRSKS